MEFLPISRGNQSRQRTGGVGTAFRRLVREGHLPAGELVGTDRFGNKYYENLSRPYGAHRFVDYANTDGPVYADEVDSEWHAWLHKMTDKRPTGKGKHKWQMDYTPNVTGTQRQYVPYSTVKPKMEYWSPQ